MIEDFVQKMLKFFYPNRNLDSIRVGNRFFTVAHDSLGRMWYSLQGKYPYAEVQKINELTNGFAKYGYCPEKDCNVAIIGIEKNPRYLDANCRFFNEVSGYGEITDLSTLELQDYSEEESKNVNDYIVYGKGGFEQIKDLVKFNKINSVLDSRFDEVKCHDYRVLNMKCELDDIFSFEEAEAFSKVQKCWAVDRGMAYGTLENGKHVAIMSFWYDKKDEVAGFRDVWESGRPEPPVQKISFMTDEEASKFDDFSLYLFDYRFFSKPAPTPKIRKIHRTLEPGFDFYNTPDGKDLRLS